MSTKKVCVFISIHANIRSLELKLSVFLSNWDITRFRFNEKFHRDLLISCILLKVYFIDVD